jgi:hypothetical protein
MESKKFEKKYQQSQQRTRFCILRDCIFLILQPHASLVATN